MKIAFTPWPEEFSQRYRDKGYWIDKPLSEILQQSCLLHPDKIAIICGQRKFSYAQLDSLSTNLANSLLRRQLKRYDKALVILPNVAEFYIVFFALLKIGVVPVNAIFSHQQNELNAYADQLQPQLLIGAATHSLFKDDQFSKHFQQQHPSIKSLLVLGETDYAENLYDCIHLPTTRKGKFQATSAELATLPEEVAFFQLSGGSTGTPKLIPRTHNDYFYSIRSSVEICQFSTHTKYLCALPAAHNFTLSSPGALGVFHVAGCVILASSPEAISCFELIATHQINTTALVPSAVGLWLQALEQHSDKIKSLKLLQVGGASFAPALATRVLDEMNCQLQQVFGMAEGLVNYTRLDDPREIIINTQGRPISEDDEIKVLDKNLAPVATGQTGILYTRGPYTVRGYFLSLSELNEKHENSAFDLQGFYNSGDLVQLTPQGYLRVVGRAKDQINRAGEKIAAEEIEKLLLQHKDILQVALVAIEDQSLGEKSCAFVVSKNANLKKIEIRKFIRGIGIAQYKLPDQYEFIETMPLTPIGKPDKKKLRSYYSEIVQTEQCLLANTKKLRQAV